MTAKIYNFPLKNKAMPQDQAKRVADKMLHKMLGAESGPLSTQQATRDLARLTKLRDSCSTVRAEVGAVCQAMADAMDSHADGTLPVLTAHRTIRWASYLLNEDYRTSHDDRDTVRHALMSFKARIGYDDDAL